MILDCRFSIRGEQKRKHSGVMILDSRVRINLTQPVLVRLEPPRFPISRTTAPVSHRDDLDGRFCNPINYGVGKTSEEKLPCTVQVQRPALRTAEDLTDGLIERCHESISCSRIALSVPEISSSRLDNSFRMGLNAWTSHRTARGSGDAQPTRELSSPFPCPTRQYAVRSPYSTLLQHPHPPSHPSFRSDNRQVRLVPRPVDAEPLLRPSYDLDSYFQIIHQAAFLQSLLRSALGRQQAPLQCLGREWSSPGWEYERSSSREIRARSLVPETRSTA